jgi:hypothetical protein
MTICSFQLSQMVIFLGKGMIETTELVAAENRPIH